MDEPFVLGVVMPVYNEESWVGRSLDALVDSARAARCPLEIVVVDDGSTDATGALLDARAERGELRVLHTPNRGRFRARLSGLQTLTTRWVLLLDARVVLDEPAVGAIRAHLSTRPDRALNAHVTVDDQGRPWGAFWSGLTKVFWRAYFTQPGPVFFGLDDFDRYPKGTGAFATERRLILDAAGRFDSLFDDERFSSDDTRLLREVARTHDIRIGRDFSCRYFGKDTASKWAQQSLFRGTTFVDGYAGTRRRAGYWLGGMALVTVAGAVGVLTQPRAAAAALVAAMVAAGAATSRSGGTRREAAAVTALMPVFAPIFGAGVVRGLWLALRKT